MDVGPSHSSPALWTWRPVKNRALLGNHSFASFPPSFGSQSHIYVEQALNEAVATYQIGSYNIVKALGDGLALTPWKQQLGGANFVYVSTHGGPDVYEMENGNPLFDDNGPDPDSHKQVLMAAVGANFTATTYPPYNASSVPPPNFVFVDTCNTFQVDFSWTLYPKVNLYDGSGIARTTNVFTGGWNKEFDVGDTERIAETIMSYLAQGWPSWQGLYKAIRDLNAAGVQTHGTGTPIDISMLGWHGDPYAKVAGVYTGTAVPLTDWHT